jgi:hypothetical protein
MNDAFKNVIKMKNNVDIAIIVQRQNYNKSGELEHYKTPCLPTIGNPSLTQLDFL